MDEWYPGRVVRVAEDGAVDVEYEDGDYEPALPPGHVRERAGGACAGATPDPATQRLL